MLPFYSLFHAFFKFTTPEKLELISTPATSTCSYTSFWEVSKKKINLTLTDPLFSKHQSLKDCYIIEYGSANLIVVYELSQCREISIKMIAKLVHQATMFKAEVSTLPILKLPCLFLDSRKAKA